MSYKSAPTIRYEVYIAGDYDHALNVLQRYVERGACVSCQRTDYVYRYGREAGICVTIINYPRFPAEQDELETLAAEVGDYLMQELGQGSYTIVGPETTYFKSRRDGD